MARTFTYRGPFEVFSQEGGYAAPGIRRVEDGDAECAPGYFTQLMSARQQDDLVTEILRDLGVELGESVRLGGAHRSMTITVEVDP